MDELAGPLGIGLKLLLRFIDTYANVNSGSSQNAPATAADHLALGPRKDARREHHLHGQLATTGPISG